jgi:diguanylate cyclase (GGDEF)-like protein
MLIAAVAVVASVMAGFVVWRLSRRSLAEARREAQAERERLEGLALEDPLTRLPNRRALEDRLDGELSRAAREYYPVAVVELAVTGAGASGEALARLARHVQAELRAGDICGRTGDSRLTIALVRADAAAAERVLERLRSALGGVGAERLTFGAGIAEFPRHGNDREAVMRCARSALGAGVKVHAGGPTGAAGSIAARRVEGASQERSLVANLSEMARAVDAKNRFTVGHSERVAAYAVALARSLGGFDDDRLDALRQAALLHDVGKVGIRETILSKEAPLNLEELSELERHSELGRAMLSGAGLPELARWVNHVHERYDGSGYPYGLAGHEIPLESRILHVADALDLMTRPNALRRNRPLREALNELSYSSGSRIDPEIAARAIDMVQSGEISVGAGPGAGGVTGGVATGAGGPRPVRQTIGRPPGVR